MGSGISAIKSPNSSMIKTLSSSSMFLMRSSSEVWVLRSGRVAMITICLGSSATSHAVSTEAGMRLARLDNWWGSKEGCGVAEVELNITELCENPSVNCS